jgi:hypothetical protein
MREWRWTIRLAKDGHRFKAGEWRCVDCRRKVFDLLENRQPCVSPNVDGEYLFLGGPLDGEWNRLALPQRYYNVTIPSPLDMHALDDDGGSALEEIMYVLKRKDGKPILAYVYEG